MKKAIIIWMFTSFTFLFLQTSINSFDKDNERVVYRTKSVFVHQQRTDYSIDVKPQIIDLIALDKNEKHIVGLESGDFEIYINGIEQKISNLDRIEYKPANLNKTKRRSRRERNQNLIQDRLFIIALLNLPSLKSRQYRIQNALEIFLYQNLCKNDKIAIINVTRNSIKQLLPFSSDKSVIKETIAKYFKPGIERENFRGEFPLVYKGENHRRLVQTEQNQLFTDVMINLNRLTEAFNQYEGKKNLILFSEELYHWINLKDEFISRKNENGRLNIKPSGSFLTPIKAIKTLSDMMNSTDVSLYTLDVGEESFSIADSNTFVNRNSGKIHARTNGYRTLSGMTGGKLYHRSLASENKLLNNLRKIDYRTSQVYRIVLYPKPELKPGSNSSLEIKTKRKGVDLYHRNSIKSAKHWPQMSALEREINLSKLLYGMSFLNQVDFEANISSFPADNNKNLALFSVKIPINKNSSPQLRDEKCYYDIHCLLMTSQRNVFETIHRQIEYDPNVNTKLKNFESIKFQHFLSLPSGRYLARFLVRNHISGSVSIIESDFSIPNNPLFPLPALGSIVPLETKNESLLISDYFPHPGNKNLKINKENPLIIQNRLVEVKTSNKYNFSPQIKVMIPVRPGKGKNKPPELKWVINFSDQNGKNQKKTDIKAKLDRIIQHKNKVHICIYNLSIRASGPGMYDITANLKDEETGIPLESILNIEIKRKQ